MSRVSRGLGIGASAILVLSAGCLRRDVAAEEPTTKTSFEQVVPQPAIDKVDLLVMVDNSYSMADKQKILADAVPNLLQGLVQPKCVDKQTRAPVGVAADPLEPEGRQCPAGSEPAFTPITDMHIGVISSSLGGMGGSLCSQPANGNDKGRLLARGPGGKDVAAAGDLHFLAWYPDVEQNRDKARHPDPPVPATTSLERLGESFRELVVGVGQEGCGFEAQLESVYRFLVQPDPWTEIDLVEEGATKRASYGPKDRVDGELLRQRAAFLRPDSLVAVVMLTDEDDSSPDPLSFQGTGWIFGEPGCDPSRASCSPLPRATSACERDPASPQCTSCQFAPTDPTCVEKGVGYGRDEENVNVRFHAMKRRFGVDPQFPISRYVDALTNKRVPARDSEHERGVYVGKADCTNPLFAARLPSSTNDDLCKLPFGPRTKDLVYFAIIGGVPGALLPTDGDPTTIDWTKILGRDPARYDADGIDEHMIASTSPRGGLPGPGASDTADPIHGREWETGGADLQFACTFPIPTPEVCPAGDELCDCDGVKRTPLCDPANPRRQIRAKAYPTRRELMVAKELGDHGIVATLCAEQLTKPDADDYGYRPAVRAIADRLEQSLVATCLPRALARDGEGGPVPCLVVATLPEPGPDAASCAKLGLAPPSPAVLDQIRDRRAADEGEASRKLPICEIPQIAAPPGSSCRDDDQRLGFCYGENLPGVKCAHSLSFTKAVARLTDARFSMQCIQVDESKSSR
ncbi:MAG: hypothetical protein KF819_12605 [Labilithrix sp.]|nr:hypothetical protein [Labilithrix sp.]